MPIATLILRELCPYTNSPVTFSKCQKKSAEATVKIFTEMNRDLISSGFRLGPGHRPQVWLSPPPNF